jgi:LysM repeat protein
MQEGQRICPDCGKARRPTGRVRCRHCRTANSAVRSTCAACGQPLQRGPRWLPFVVVASLVIALAALAWIGHPLLEAGPQGTGAPPAAATQSVAGATVAQATATEHPPSPQPSDTPPPSTSTSPAPTLTPSPTVTATPTATDTPTPTATPTATKTSTPTRTPTPAPTATPTSSPTPTETPSPEPSPSASPSPTPFVYVVQSGDNLYDIAQRFGVTVDAIMAANNLTSTRLRVGQTLIIPLPTPTPTATP